METRIEALFYAGFIGFLSGGLAGTRTLDQCLKRALLYQLSYQPTSRGLVSVLSGIQTGARKS